MKRRNLDIEYEIAWAESEINEDASFGPYIHRHEENEEEAVNDDDQD